MPTCGVSATPTPQLRSYFHVNTRWIGHTIAVESAAPSAVAKAGVPIERDNVQRKRVRYPSYTEQLVDPVERQQDKVGESDLGYTSFSFYSFCSYLVFVFFLF